MRPNTLRELLKANIGVRHFCIGTDINILHQWWKGQGDDMRKALEGA